jgi:hypothetical protein
MSKVICPEPGSQLTIGSVSAPVFDYPQDAVIAARRAALEEAATVCRNLAATSSSKAEISAMNACAEAISALIERHE